MYSTNIRFLLSHNIWKKNKDFVNEFITLCKLPSCATMKQGSQARSNSEVSLESKRRHTKIYLLCTSSQSTVFYDVGVSYQKDDVP